MKKQIVKESFAAMCRHYTNLTAVQCQLLRRMDAVFPFAADLVHAHLSVYIKTRDQAGFIVLRHYQPHTFFSEFELAVTGTIVPAIEEPLVAYTFDSGKEVQGQREWKLNHTLDMFTWPVYDGGTVIAVITLESGGGFTRSKSYHKLLDTTKKLMEYARRGVDPELFQPIYGDTGIIIADKNNRIIYVNMSATRIYRALGIVHLVGCRLPDRELGAMLHRETIDSSRPYEKEMQIGGLILVQRDIKLEDGGAQLQRILLLSDVTQIRKKEREIKIKTTVIKEIHHRVKNNLQTIASLLRLQARRSQSREVKDALQESINRILSMSVVHEFLSQNDTEEINVIEVTRNIMAQVVPNMVDRDFRLQTEISGPEVVLPSKNASNLAVIINELVLNSIEHGFAGRDHGLLGLKTQIVDDGYLIEMYDDGTGLPPDFDIDKTKSLGLRIIRTLVSDDMQGSFEMYDENGVHSILRVPRNPEGGEY